MKGFKNSLLFLRLYFAVIAGVCTNSQVITLSETNPEGEASGDVTCGDAPDSSASPSYFVPNQTVDQQVTFVPFNFTIQCVQNSNVRQTVQFRLYNNDNEVWGEYQLPMINDLTYGRNTKQFWMPAGFGDVARVELNTVAPPCGDNSMNVYYVHLFIQQTRNIAAGFYFAANQTYVIPFSPLSNTVVQFDNTSSSSDCSPKDIANVDDKLDFQLSAEFSTYNYVYNPQQKKKFLNVELQDDGGNAVRYRFWLNTWIFSQPSATAKFSVPNNFGQVQRMSISFSSMEPDDALPLTAVTLADRRTKSTECISQKLEIPNKELTFSAPAFFDVNLS